MPRIFLDLDGVLADFFLRARDLLGCDYHSLPPAEAWRALSEIPHLYLTLAVLPDAHRLYAVLSPLGDRLSILTAIPLPTGYLVTAAADKRQWVAENISPSLPVHTVAGGENKRLFASPGDILIDDSERNIRAWESVGGIGVLHTELATTLVRLREFGIASR